MFPVDFYLREIEVSEKRTTESEMVLSGSEDR